MTKTISLLLMLLLVSFAGNAQSVGIGTTTPNASAALDVRSTNRGLLIPTMTLAQRNAISNPATGLLIFQSDGTAGFYYNGGTSTVPSWKAMITSNTGWQTTGNSGTNPNTHFIGTTDNAALRFKINNVNAGYIDSTLSNTAIGFRALDSLTTGSLNTAVGYNALRYNTNGYYNTANGTLALFSNTTGYFNTASGTLALRSNTTGINNTANGTLALFSNTTGGNNTAIGYNSLFTNTTGFGNTANGADALSSNTTGYANCAYGSSALRSNTTGYSNTASGTNALIFNTSGYNNTANGIETLFSNTTGSNNTAQGAYALNSNTTGYQNSANGYGALRRNTVGIRNTASGYDALTNNSNGSYNTASGYNTLSSNLTGSANTAVGYDALSSLTNGTGNTAIGFGALQANTTGNFITAIGYQATPFSGWNPSNFTAIGYNAGKIGGNSNTIEIGNSSVTWIGGQVNWSTYSDETIKDDIRADVPGLEFIKRLRPVSYHLNIHRQNDICAIYDTTTQSGKYDIEKRIQTGFLAQEVERAAKEINYDFSGVTAPKGNAKLYSLSYAEFVVPLVKGMQEQQAIVEKLQQEINELRQDIKNLKEKKDQ